MVNGILILILLIVKLKKKKELIKFKLVMG